MGTPVNNAFLSGINQLKDAMKLGTVLEARAVKCDREHNLHVDLGCIRGIIPHDEGALGIREGKTRDIALISRVGKPVCFTVTDIVCAGSEDAFALLSREDAQRRCEEEYIASLVCGDVINVRITHMESFGAFCDVGAGICALLPIDSISVSRIPHPSARFHCGQEIRAAVKQRDSEGRLILTHKELLGTWDENAALFRAGETVPGIIRSVESYGVFIELTPNLAGLAEYTDSVRAGQTASVFIKSIIPERKKIKLIIVDSFDEKPPVRDINYFFTGDHIELEPAV